MIRNSFPLNFYVVLTLSLGVLLLFFYLLYPFSLLFFWGAILAYFFYPLYKRLLKIFKRRFPSAILIILIFIFFIFFPLIFLTLHLYNQITDLINFLNQYTFEDIFNYFNQFKDKFFFSKLYSYLEPHLQSLQENLSAYISSFMQKILQRLSSFVLGTFGFIIKFVFTLLIFYYFLVDGEKIVKIIEDLIPGSLEEKERILERISLILQAVLYGNLLTALIQGFISLGIYYFLGIPQPILFSLLTILASFIPLGGTALIWVPLALYLFIIGSYGKGFLLVIFCSLTVAQVDNILKPILISGRTKIHNLLMFFAVIGGINRFGLTGLFLGPLILGLSLSVIELYKTRWLPSSKEESKKENSIT